MEIAEGILENEKAKNKALVLIRETELDKISIREEMNGYCFNEEENKEFENLKDTVLHKFSSKRNILEYKVNRN